MQAMTLDADHRLQGRRDRGARAPQGGRPEDRGLPRRGDGARRPRHPLAALESLRRSPARTSASNPRPGGRTSCEVTADRPRRRRRPGRSTRRIAARRSRLARDVDPARRAPARPTDPDPTPPPRPSDDRTSDPRPDIRSSRTRASPAAERPTASHHPSRMSATDLTRARRGPRRPGRATCHNRGRREPPLAGVSQDRDRAVASAEGLWTRTRSNCWSSTRSAPSSPRRRPARSARTPRAGWSRAPTPARSARARPSRPRWPTPSRRACTPRSAACTTSARSSAGPRSARRSTAEELAETVETLKRDRQPRRAGSTASATSSPGSAG